MRHKLRHKRRWQVAKKYFSLWRSLPITVRLGCGLCFVALITLLVQGYRLEYAPDVFSDEGVYLLVGMNIAKGLGLVADNQPFVWHPPSYMLLEATYISLRGLGNADPLTALLATRWLNIGLSTLTSLWLVFFGQRLHSYRAGFIAAALFLIDPYIQRINRRNMLETLAMLSILLGLDLFFAYRFHPARWKWIGAGLAFGVAVLTKEAMFIEVFALCGTIVLLERKYTRIALGMATVACALYLIYPLWLFATGEGENYIQYKRFGVSRIIDVALARSLSSSTVTLPPSTRGGLLESLLSRLSQYGMSYVLIFLATLFTLVLLLRYRERLEVRYLCIWSLFSIGFGLGLGRVSDQYFYYLIVPATLVVGYFLATIIAVRRIRKFWLLQGLLLTIVFTMWLYNGIVWAKTYVIGSDSAYMEIIRCIQTTLPPGTVIEASDDVAVYYLSPHYRIRLDRDVQTIVNEQARYFILSEKDVLGGYDGMTPQLYNWVIQHGEPMFLREDLSFGTIGLYKLRLASAKEVSSPEQCYVPGTSV